MIQITQYNIRGKRQVWMGARADETIFAFDIDRRNYVRLFLLRKEWRTPGTEWFLVHDSQHRTTVLRTGYRDINKDQALQDFLQYTRELIHASQITPQGEHYVDLDGS